MTAPALVPNLREAGCGKLRRLLDSYLAGELSVETNHEVLEHLERCPACRAEAEARERLRAQVKRVGSRLGGELPEGLEERVRAALARTPPARPRPVGALLLAASLVGAAGLGALLVARLRPAHAPTTPSIAVQRHQPPHVPSGVAAAAYHVAAGTQVLCTLHYDWPKDPPPLARLRKRLAERYHPALRSVLNVVGDTGGYQVMAAHECAHGERPVLHFILRREGERDAGSYVSVIAFQKGEASLAGDAVLAEEHVRSDRGESTVLLTGGRREGFDIMGAENAGYFIFLVGSRGHQETMELGRRLLPALVTSLV